MNINHLYETITASDVAKNNIHFPFCDYVSIEDCNRKFVKNAHTKSNKVI